jgi:Spx/MgsR family transcriptional regulator
VITLYGIKNCDTCTKARKWLAGEGIAHRFVDIRREGLRADLIAAWSAAIGWDTLINRRSTTWRTLSDTHKACFAKDVADTADTDTRTALVRANPTLIKRPVFYFDGETKAGDGETKAGDGETKAGDGEIRVGFKDADKAFIRARFA